LKALFKWPLALATVLIVLSLPSVGSAFSLTSTDFSGYGAFDRAGDVVGKFGLDPRLSYDYTGQYFNLAVGIQFSFEYNPTYPSLVDVMDHQYQDWKWTLGINNISFPGFPIAMNRFEMSHIGSYHDLMTGASFARGWLQNHGITGAYVFDWSFDDHTQQTGTASLMAAAWVNPELIPGFVPDEFCVPFRSGASVDLSAEPVPEPATMLLFGVGIAGLGAYRKRRNRKK